MILFFQQGGPLAVTGPFLLDRKHERFVLYKDILRETSEELEIEVQMDRFPIPDLSVPSQKEMMRILDRIDQALGRKLPVYVHCWHGVGRTGTVVGCYLMRHGLAIADNVLERIAELRRDEATALRRSPETDRQCRMVQSWLSGK